MNEPGRTPTTKHRRDLRAGLAVLTALVLCLIPALLDAHSEPFPTTRGEEKPTNELPPLGLLPGAATGETPSGPAATTPSGDTAEWRLLSRVLVEEPPLRMATAPGRKAYARAIKALRDAAAGRSERLASAAITALGLVRDSGAAEFLEKVAGLRTRPDEQRGRALFSLGLIGGETKLLHRHAGRASEAGVVRAGATLGLAIRDGDRAVPFLLEQLGKGDTGDDVAGIFVLALGVAGNPIAARDLGQLATAESQEPLGGLATAALGRLSDAESAPAALLALLGNESSWVRDQAALSLGRYEAVAPKLEVVTAAHPDPRTRAFAALGLGRIGAPTSISTLARALADESGPVRERAAAGLAAILRSAAAEEREPALEALATALDGETHPGMRAVLVLALASGGRDAVKKVLLKEMRGTAAPELRGVLARAAGSAGVRDAVPTLRRWLMERADWSSLEQVARGLSELGEDDLERILVSWLQPEREEHRRGAAIRILATLRATSAVGPLADLVADADEPEHLRAQAVSALATILDPHEESVRGRLFGFLDPALIRGLVQEVHRWL